MTVIDPEFLSTGKKKKKTPCRLDVLERGSNIPRFAFCSDVFSPIANQEGMCDDVFR